MSLDNKKHLLLLVARSISLTAAFAVGVANVAEAGKPNFYGAPNKTKIRYDAGQSKRLFTSAQQSRLGSVVATQAIPRTPKGKNGNGKPVVSKPRVDAATGAKLAVEAVFNPTAAGQLANLAAGLQANGARFGAKLLNETSSQLVYEMTITAKAQKRGKPAVTRGFGQAVVDRVTGQVTRVYGEPKPQPQPFKISVKQGADAATQAFRHDTAAARADFAALGRATIGMAVESSGNISYSSKAIGQDPRFLYYEVQMNSSKTGKKGKKGKRSGSLTLGWVAVDGQTGLATKLDRKPSL